MVSNSNEIQSELSDAGKFFLFFAIMRELISRRNQVTVDHISHVLEGIFLYVKKRAPGPPNKHLLGGSSSQQ